MSKIVGTLALALALVGLGGGDAMATLTGSTVKCGNVACVEVWKVKCASSRVIRARVRDAIGNDDTLAVTLVGVAPVTIKGDADVQVPLFLGGFSSNATVVAKANSTLSAFAVVTNFSNTGDSVYQLEVVCQRADGTLVDPAALTLVQGE